MTAALAIFAAILPLRYDTPAESRILAEDVSFLHTAMTERVNAPLPQGAPHELSWTAISNLARTVSIHATPVFYDYDSISNYLKVASVEGAIAAARVYAWDADTTHVESDMGITPYVYATPAGKSTPELSLDFMRRLFYDARNMVVKDFSGIYTNDFVTHTAYSPSGQSSVTTNAFSSFNLYYRSISYGAEAEDTVYRTYKDGESLAVYEDKSDSGAFAILGWDVEDTKYDGTTTRNRKRVFIPVALVKSDGWWRFPGWAFSGDLAKSLLSLIGGSTEITDQFKPYLAHEIFVNGRALIGPYVVKEYPQTNLREVDWNWKPQGR